MKRSFTIGRDSQNDIVISDPSDLVSRLHATLKVDEKGRYKIMDQSTNGTYVNGIRLEKFVDVPVTRKDEISLASVAILDWDDVPKSKKNTSWIIAACVAVGLIVLGLLTYVLINNDIININPKQIPQNGFVAEKVDTFKVVPPINSNLEWNQTSVEFEVKGNVEWKVKVTNKDGKPVDKVTVSPEAGQGAKKVVVTLPKNNNYKADVVYLISVYTEAQVKPQSCEMMVVQKRRPSNNANSGNKQTTNNPVLI